MKESTHESTGDAAGSSFQKLEEKLVTAHKALLELAAASQPAMQDCPDSELSHYIKGLCGQDTHEFTRRTRDLWQMVREHQGKPNTWAGGQQVTAKAEDCGQCCCCNDNGGGHGGPTCNELKEEALQAASVTPEGMGECCGHWGHGGHHGGPTCHELAPKAVPAATPGDWDDGSGGSHCVLFCHREVPEADQVKASADCDDGGSCGTPGCLVANEPSVIHPMGCCSYPECDLPNSLHSDEKQSQLETKPTEPACYNPPPPCSPYPPACSGGETTNDSEQ
jgi:hypothetical protein